LCNGRLPRILPGRRVPSAGRWTLRTHRRPRPITERPQKSLGRHWVQACRLQFGRPDSARDIFRCAVRNNKFGACPMGVGPPGALSPSQLTPVHPRRYLSATVQTRSKWQVAWRITRSAPVAPRINQAPDVHTLTRRTCLEGQDGQAASSRAASGPDSGITVICMSCCAGSISTGRRREASQQRNFSSGAGSTSAVVRSRISSIPGTVEFAQDHQLVPEQSTRRRLNEGLSRESQERTAFDSTSTPVCPWTNMSFLLHAIRAASPVRPCRSTRPGLLPAAAVAWAPWMPTTAA
jgi:hypothetical protein